MPQNLSDLTVEKVGREKKIVRANEFEEVWHRHHTPLLSRSVRIWYGVRLARG